MLMRWMKVWFQAGVVLMGDWTMKVLPLSSDQSIYCFILNGLLGGVSSLREEGQWGCVCRGVSGSQLFPAFLCFLVMRKSAVLHDLIPWCSASLPQAHSHGTSNHAKINPSSVQPSLNLSQGWKVWLRHISRRINYFWGKKLLWLFMFPFEQYPIWYVANNKEFVILFSKMMKELHVWELFLFLLQRQNVF